MSDRVTLVYDYDDELGVKLQGFTLWFKHFRADSDILISPDQTHILIPGSPDTILDVAELEAEAKMFSKQAGQRSDGYNWTWYTGRTLSESIDISNCLRSEQSGNELEIVAKESYTRLNLITGEILESFMILSYDEDWVLTVKNENLNLLHLGSRQSVQLTRDCEIEAAYLHSRNSYCLVAAGGLVMYYLQQPYELMNDASTEHPPQWKNFPLFDAESIFKIEPAHKEFEFIIELRHPDQIYVLINIKTGKYRFINEDERELLRIRLILNDEHKFYEVTHRLGIKIRACNYGTSDMKDLLFSLERRFSGIRQNLKKKRVSKDDFDKEWNEIVKGLLSIIQQLETEFSTSGPD